MEDSSSKDLAKRRLCTSSIGEVLEALYASEINCLLKSFWDGGWDVRLGDSMNGWKADNTVRTLPEAATFLHVEALKHFPKSQYAALHKDAK